LIVAAITIVSCGTKKKAVQSSESEVAQPAVPAWHTCVIQSSRASIVMDGDKFSSNITMQTVRDSMLVISVTPIMGIEMMRLEATPLDLTAFDKMHGKYAKASYAELNRKLTPSLNWDILQQISTGELPTGSEKARLVYSVGEKEIEVVIEYSERKLDVPVRINSLPVSKYTKIDINRWL